MKHFWTLTIPSALLVFAMIAQGQDAPETECARVVLLATAQPFRE